MKSGMHLTVDQRPTVETYPVLKSTIYLKRDDMTFNTLMNDFMCENLLYDLLINCITKRMLLE